MSSTEAARRPALAPRFSLVSLIVAAALVAAAGVAWVWLLASPMGGGAAMAMQPEPFSGSYLLPAFAMWAIMMVAMMVPSAAPMILLHARVVRATPGSRRLAHTLLFGLAYVLVWTSFSAIAAVMQAALVAAGAVSTMTLSLGSRWVAACVLIGAALYEFTAAKRLCLDQCQSPLLFFYRHWRPGAAGAFWLGIVHGLFCLGCCWTLMLLLFVGGVMNLAWVALLGIVVLGEKFAPPSWRLDRLIAATLIVAAIGVLIR